ncbi:TPA: DUF4238 domain-containing protein [Legionella bozemanae]|uniref:DUF4238 domain-containing protein n=1 Tax=Legionella bozemanae TaxID=447 RepID=UPI002E26CF51
MYLDLYPEQKVLPDGKIISMKNTHYFSPQQCFYEYDLYTTFFGSCINDDIERLLFGEIDRIGAPAVRAYTINDCHGWHKNFKNFFKFIDALKTRTPKGLDWIKNHYSGLKQEQLMKEMQSIHNLHCVIWTEGVREIVSAKNSNIKFILSDHPVTVYNPACLPNDEKCKYPNDPSILLKGSQTIFPLNENHCLILTNLEYANNHEDDPLEKRTNPQFLRETLVSTIDFIWSRELNEVEVSEINYILKKGAKKYIASSNEDWLHPEKIVSSTWCSLKKTLLPPENELNRFNSEIIIGGFKDGSTYSQDVFGRKIPENKYLKKVIVESELKRNDLCGCGSGKRYKNCCKDIPKGKRKTWKELSIRERNIVLYDGIRQILKLDKDSSWDDIRQRLSDNKIVEIYSLYGSLWPSNTDIFGLLPQPDSNLRALYTGMLDPRSTGIHIVTGLVPYFDEILIQHPFLNPGILKEEINPIKNPSLYRQQLLKDLWLILHLQIFVESGVVNLVPDITAFNLKITKEMYEMARQRSESEIINEKEVERLKNIVQDDSLITYFSLPKEILEQSIKKENPNISSDKLKELVDYCSESNRSNPFAPLQDSPESKNFLAYNMVPNFEMSLYISQTTGALIITDSESRWQQIIKSQYRDLGIARYPWNNLSEQINSREFTLNLNPEITYDYGKREPFINIKNTFREIFNIIKNDIAINNTKMRKLREELTKSYLRTLKIEDKHNNFKAKISILMPKGGFTDHNVQRLLLKSGSDKHLKYVPISIFINCHE